jgi:uncharacterized protein YjbJ (UPF0337 family)
MGDETDKLKGKLKEGVGKATDDESLEREGQLDQAKGKAKDALEHGKDALEDTKDALKRD